MQKTINNITYTSRSDSNVRLIVIPKEGQTPVYETQDMIDARSYPLSERNGANAYILPVEKDKVYLNFIAQKLFVDDMDIREHLKPAFEYFVEEVIPPIDLYTLEDGIIYRCVSAESMPTSKENYTYYIMMNGVAKQIPDYKTLEVMLAERNQTLLSVRVLEKTQCEQIPKDSGAGAISSKAGAWSPAYSDQTSLETLRQLENNAAAAEAIAESAKSTADVQIAAVKAQAEASSAAAASSAANAAAATAQANAATAAANQAKAEADAAKAEAELAKAIAESGAEPNI